MDEVNLRKKGILVKHEENISHNMIFSRIMISFKHSINHKYLYFGSHVLRIELMVNKNIIYMNMHDINGYSYLDDMRYCKS